jgi:hypothetical protein
LFVIIEGLLLIEILLDDFLFELEEVVDKHASEYLGFRIKLVF